MVPHDGNVSADENELRVDLLKKIPCVRAPAGFTIPTQGFIPHETDAL